MATIEHVEFKLELGSGNAAVTDDPREAVRYALQGVLDAMNRGQSDGNLRDTNGNKIGFWYLDIAEDA